METIMAKELTLSQLINMMRQIIGTIAESAYAYSDLLTDIGVIAKDYENHIANQQKQHSTILWGVRKNGTTIKAFTVQLAKWAAEMEALNESPKCYRIILDEGKYTLTFLG